MHTPVGQRPYDIEFKRIDSKCISGTADNGASLHTWTFCVENTELRLTFLSDFAGNTRPFYFKTIAYDEQFITFMADSHQFMKVQFKRSGKERWIRVIHHGKLHVEIKLNK